jgi:type VI secretion system protein ImpK
MLVDAFWDGREWWSNNVLEIELFNTRECNERFFIKAQQASTSAGRDALEVFYVCVILGFRGLYHNMETGSTIAPSLNLPFSLGDWAKQVALAVRLGQGREALSRPTMEIHGAPPLRSRASVVWPWLALVLTAAAVAVVWLNNR